VPGADQAAIVSSSRCVATKRMPVSRAGQNASAAVRGASRTRIPARISAETASSTALPSNVSGAPSSLISAPAAAGPAMSAAELASPLRACASTSRSRGTIWVSTICAALPDTVLTTPSRNPTTYSQAMSSQPVHHASVTLAIATASMVSPAT